MIIMRVFRHRATDVHRCKQRKYISLNRGHEQFDDIDKGHHDRTHDPDRDRLEDERQSDKTQDHNVTCRDGDKKSDHQGERLGKQTDDLNRYDNQRQRK